MKQEEEQKEEDMQALVAEDIYIGEWISHEEDVD